MFADHAVHSGVFSGKVFDEVIDGLLERVTIVRRTAIG